MSPSSMPARSRIGARPGLARGFARKPPHVPEKTGTETGTCPDSRADRPSRPGRNPILERRADVLLAEPPNARQVAVVSNTFDATDKRCRTQPRRAVPRRAKPRRGGAAGGRYIKDVAHNRPAGAGNVACRSARRVPAQNRGNTRPQPCPRPSKAQPPGEKNEQSHPVLPLRWYPAALAGMHVVAPFAPHLVHAKPQHRRDGQELG